MKAQVEPISPVKARLSVEVSPEEVAKEEETAYQNLRRTTTVPGFRRGKVPVSVLKRLYRERVRSEIITRLIQTTYQETLEKEEIVPVSEADIQLQSDPSAGGLSYTAVVEVRPEIEPRGYKELHLTKDRVRVEEPEVEARIEALRAGRATFEPSPEDHAVGDDDLVVLDYTGTIDGEPFDGGSAQDRSILVGSNMLLAGFESGLKGMASGEERVIDVEFPEDYEAGHLAGKMAQFQVAIKEVKTRRLPDLDDEFAKDVAGVEHVEELWSRVREATEAEKANRVEQQFRERTIDALLEANPFEVPESMIRAQQKHSMDRMRQDLEQRGLDPDTMGLEETKIQEAHQRGAERAVRWAFLLRAMAEVESLEVRDEDVDDRIREIAEADGRPHHQIRAFFEEEDRLDSLRSSILERKVIDRVVESATVEEVETELAE